MSLVLVRVDDRLIHGQVTEVWVPHLTVHRILVVDDRVAQDSKEKKILTLGVSSSTQVEFLTVKQLVAQYPKLTQDKTRILVLFGRMDLAYQVYIQGFHYSHLNLGNIHEESGTKALSPSVCVNPGSFGQLKTLAQAGVTVTLQAIPSEREVSLQEFLK
ncbi:MAG: PTS sugar transporter subunit IIB [Deltaproteobacteria bacterium]|nr:PTS sugar transporter subunit IIB [Deltaproteobacteria bacterium]